MSFSSQQDADQAVTNWNGKETNGRELKVQPATEPKPIPVKPVKAASTGAGPETTEESGDKKKKRKPRKPKKVCIFLFFNIVFVVICAWSIRLGLIYALPLWIFALFVLQSSKKYNI